MSAVQICPTSVFAVTPANSLTQKQRAALRLIDVQCIGTDSTIGIGAIKRLVEFDSHIQAVYIINDLVLRGWLLTHDGTYRPSPKTINWLRAQGARAGLSAVTQEQNHVV